MFRFFSLDEKEREHLIACLQNTQQEFLIAYDSIDDAMKWKVDGGIWSPPAGKAQ
jgi:hypothetical protein